MRIQRKVEGAQPFQKFQPEMSKEGIIKGTMNEFRHGDGTSCAGSCGCDSADGCAECGCGRSPNTRK